MANSKTLYLSDSKQGVKKGMPYYQLHINTKIFKGSCRKMLLNVNNCLLETQLVSDVAKSKHIIAVRK